MAWGLAWCLMHHLLWYGRVVNTHLWWWLVTHEIHFANCSVEGPVDKAFRVMWLNPQSACEIQEAGCKRKEHLQSHYLQKAIILNSLSSNLSDWTHKEHYLSLHLSKYRNITSSFMCDIITHCLRINWPVSLVVVLILIRADQLVGAGLVSQQA